jgi:uncharacterized iron-regulated membrane protein
MFCTQCGTQADQGNFCRNCGARLGQAAGTTSNPVAGNDDPAPYRSEITAPSTAARVSSLQAQPQPTSLTPERGRGNKLIIVAAGVAVLLVAATGVYFGMDLTKPSVVATAPRVPEPVSKSADAPALPSFEDTKEPVPAAGNSSASVNPPLSEPLPPTTEAPKRAAETLPKPAPRADVPPAPTESQMQRAGQDGSVPGRAAKSQPPLPASRGGAAAGVYETRRTTSVHEEPSASAKTVASIPQGTQVTVVGSSGDWLEVHSKRGNPPGFIRREDATFIEKSN